MDILGIIPARGGSKGIPRKNIVDVAGKPLLVWTIEAAIKAERINRVIVSSDDDEILTIAKRYGAEGLKRPLEYATDTATYQPLVFHVLDTLKRQGYEPDYLIYLQPTSPLRDHADIDAAFDEFFVHKEATALVSVVEVDNKFLKTFLVNEKGYLGAAVNDEFPFMNRQDLPPLYMHNGAIYIIKPEVFRKNKQLFSDKTVPFVMSAEKSIDVDTQENLKEIETLLRR